VAATWIHDLVRPGRQLARAGDGLLSALGPGERDSPYDRHAVLYDHVVGNRLYNRLLWGASPASYTAFAATAVAGAQGPLLDVGCGSAVFTAAAYRTAGRPLVLVDRSLGMLARAAQRLGGPHLAAVLRVLGGQVAAGGSLYVTSLVAETAIGSRGLGLLHRAGEAAVPRREQELVTAARAALDGPVRSRRKGFMVFLSAGPLT